MDKVLIKDFAYTDKEHFDKGLFSVRLFLTLCFIFYFFNDTFSVQDKRALLSYTTGTQPAMFTAQDKNGDLKCDLCPILVLYHLLKENNTLHDCVIVTFNSTLQQGTLAYCGFKMYEPEIFPSPACASDEKRKSMLTTWGERLKNIVNVGMAAPLKPESCQKTSESGESQESPEDRKKSGV